MDMDSEIYQHLTQTEHAMERAELLCRADPCVEQLAGARVRALHAAAKRAKRDFARTGGESPLLCEELVDLERTLVRACESCPQDAGEASPGGLQAALHDALREVRDLRRQLHGEDPVPGPPPGSDGPEREPAGLAR